VRAVKLDTRYIQGYSQVIMGLTTSRYQLIFLFFNESKTAFIKKIFSCHYVTFIRYFLCLNKNNLKNLH
jgi:hypothetical protein